MIIDNQKLVECFECSPQGGMRYSKKTNSLVLVSNHVKSVYEDFSLMTFIIIKCFCLPDYLPKKSLIIDLPTLAFIPILVRGIPVDLDIDCFKEVIPTNLLREKLNPSFLPIIKNQNLNIFSHLQV